jgi:hypothetical protein
MIKSLFGKFLDWIAKACSGGCLEREMETMVIKAEHVVEDAIKHVIDDVVHASGRLDSALSEL